MSTATARVCSSSIDHSIDFARLGTRRKDDTSSRTLPQTALLPGLSRKFRFATPMNSQRATPRTGVRLARGGPGRGVLKTCCTQSIHAPTERFQERWRALGPDHPNTLLAMSNLASVPRDQCKFEEAEPKPHDANNRSARIAFEHWCQPPWILPHAVSGGSISTDLTIAYPPAMCIFTLTIPWCLRTKPRTKFTSGGTEC